MTPETSEVVAKLRDLETLKEAKEKLTKKFEKQKAETTEKFKNQRKNLQQEYGRQQEKYKKSVPVAPLKKAIKSTTPPITGVEIRFIVALILSIVMIIVSISTFVKIRKINDLVDNPGEAYAEWCEALMLKGNLDKMTEDEWEPIQEDWEKHGITVTWDDVVKLNQKDEINIYSGRIAYVILEGKLDSLPKTGGFCAFVAIVGIILSIVWRKGFKDFFDTASHVLDIPKIKRQNEINTRYNNSEYPKLMQAYNDSLKKHEEKIAEYKKAYTIACNDLQNEEEKEQQFIESDKQKSILDIDERIKQVCDGLPHNVNKISDYELLYIISSLVNGAYSTFDEAFERIQEINRKVELERMEREFEQKRVVFDDFSSTGGLRRYSRNDEDDYTEELSRHNREMERMERERMQMEKDIARKEEREREKAKQQARMDDIRQREQARLKCKGCVNLGKCKTSAMLNSLSCGAYRPK